MDNFPLYRLATSADARFPAAPFFGLLRLDKENSLAFPVDYPLMGKWGEIISQSEPIEGNDQCPRYVSACWLSLREETFYFYEAEINQEKLEKALAELGNTSDNPAFIIGFGGMGMFTLWLQSDTKSCIVQSESGMATYVPMRKFIPVRPDLDKTTFCNISLAKSDNCFSDIDYYIIANCTKQYRYRCYVEYKNFDDGNWIDLAENTIPNLDWIDIGCIDGTFDKAHNGDLIQYHTAGIPDRMALQFHKEKKDYAAYFFLETQEMIEVFHKFYGAHPETKADFIIRIDAEAKKYELALYRQGLKEPVVIPESAYQLIVFKNKFEDYRSENYNQPRGAWIW